MPAPRKIDLIPAEFRDWLGEELMARGFGGIVDVTDALNFRLEEAGIEVRIGKSAVGEHSKLLKDQREAFAMAETLLDDMDLKAEGEMHRVLMQMIATSAMQMMRSVREGDGHLEPKDLASLGKMLKDLMGSTQTRENLLEGERARIAAEAREAQRAELDAALSEGAERGDVTKEAMEAARRLMGFA